MKFKLTEDITKDAYKIRWWWDRKSQNYVIQVLDSNNYEIESMYAGNKDDLEFLVSELKNKHNIVDARKYNKGE